MNRSTLFAAIASLGAILVALGLVRRSRGAAQDSDLTLVFTPSAAFGGTSDTLLALSALRAGGVGVDAADRIYVLNAVEHRIEVFDSHGTRRAAWGRSGGGPGELRNSFSSLLAVTPSGEAWVYDRGKRALVGFSPSGDVLGEIPLRVGGFLWGFAMNDARQPLLLTNRGDSVVLRRELAGRADTLAVRILPAPRPLAAEKCGLTGHADRPIFSGGLLWAARGDVVALAPTDSFGVEFVHASGDRHRSARPKELVPSSAAMAASTMPEGWFVEIAERGRCTIPAEEVVSQVGFMPHVPAYEQLIVQPDGGAWAIRTTLPGEARRVDIFHSSQGYVGTGLLGQVRPVAFLSDGRVLSLEKDANDAPMLVVYVVSGVP